MQRSEMGTGSKGQLVGMTLQNRTGERRTRPDNESETIQRMLAEKTAMMEENSQKIAIRDTEIFHLKGQVKQKQTEIVRLESQIKVLRGDISNKDHQAGGIVEQLNQQIEQLNQQLEEADEIIDELEKMLTKCLAKVKGLLGGSGKHRQLNQSSQSINFNEFIKDLNENNGSLNGSSILKASRHNQSISRSHTKRGASRVGNESCDVEAIGQELLSHICLLENKIRQESESVLRKVGEYAQLNQQIEEQRKTIKLLREQLKSSEDDASRLKDKQKMLEEIYKKSEESRSTLIREQEQLLTRAMNRDTATEKTIDQVRSSKRILQSKVQQLEKRLQLIMEENVHMRLEGTRQHQEMLQNMRKLQKHFDDRVRQREIEIKNTLRQSR